MSKVAKKEIVMNTSDIQKRINPMPAMLSAKGKHRPDVCMQLNANAGGHIRLGWYRDRRNSVWADESQYVKFDDVDGIAKALSEAIDFINAMPSPEEAKFKEFMTALGGVIDLGKDNGIEVEFINPLIATMKRLSENAITYQAAA